MPRLVDGESRTSEVARVVNDVLAEDGIAALTMRTIAGRLRLSPSTLHVHYGSRERMLQVVAYYVGSARVRHLEMRVQLHGIVAFVPVEDDDLVDLRAWLGWVEMARGTESLVRPVEDVRDLERDALSRAVGHQLAGPELDWLGAVVDGLAVATCRPCRPMSRQRARDWLLRATEAMFPEGVPDPAPPPWTLVAHWQRDAAG